MSKKKEIDSNNKQPVDFNAMMVCLFGQTTNRNYERN